MSCPYRSDGHRWHPLTMPKATTKPFLTVTWGCVCGAYKEVRHDIDLAAVERGGRECEEETAELPQFRLPVQDRRTQPKAEAEEAEALTE